MSNSRTQRVRQFARIFKALSNPNRLRIFLRLASCCAPGRTYNSDAEMCACVGEVGKALGIAPSTVSHHMKELRHAGLIRMERRGQSIECWVDPETLRALSSFFAEAASEQFAWQRD